MVTGSTPVNRTIFSGETFLIPYPFIAFEMRKPHSPLMAKAKKPTQLVSFGFKQKRVVRIEKDTPLAKNLKSPNRLRASDARMHDLVKKVVAVLDKTNTK